jgi:hypothetical protein
MLVPVLWSSLAGLLYACLGISVGRWLSSYAPQTYQLYFYAIMWLVALGWGWKKGVVLLPNQFPSIFLLVVICAIGVLYYFADWAMFNAFNYEKHIIIVFIALNCVMPLSTALINFFMNGGTINKFHILAIGGSVFVAVCATLAQRQHEAQQVALGIQ